MYCPCFTQTGFDLLIVFRCRKSEEKCLHTSHYNPTPLDHLKETSFLENHSLSKQTGIIATTKIFFQN